ncbi:prepilin peptidase [Polynucleobacter necessarius]|uniref:prepilin peptidase n=1 Tax=Polynucleobacter necessarius TaxID=576610 RepID=UPI000E095D8C|nr:A24 family peptidase [Polynucleobacter necessarius]
MLTFSAFDLVHILAILILLYLAYVDLLTFRLPDVITIPFAAVGLLLNYLPNLGFTDFLNAILGSIFGYFLIWGLNTLYRWIKKPNAIGMGDAKLLGALGAWLGLSSLPSILFIASVTGLIGGLLWLRVKKQSLQSAIPFGPFLAIAGIIELLCPQFIQTLILNHLI